MQKYEIIIYWSNEDRVFVAEVPELPGCMAHGETEEVALKNIKDAIQLWIDTAREFGDPVLSLKDVVSCMHEPSDVAELIIRADAGPRVRYCFKSSAGAAQFRVGVRFAAANAELSLRLQATRRRSASLRANKSLEPNVMACTGHLPVAASSCIGSAPH